jgi:hypothetical protein
VGSGVSVNIEAAAFPVRIGLYSSTTLLFFGYMLNKIVKAAKKNRQMPAVRQESILSVRDRIHDTLLNVNEIPFDTIFDTNFKKMLFYSGII